MNNDKGLSLFYKTGNTYQFLCKLKEYPSLTKDYGVPHDLVIEPDIHRRIKDRFRILANSCREKTFVLVIENEKEAAIWTGYYVAYLKRRNPLLAFKLISNVSFKPVHVVYIYE